MHGVTMKFTTTVYWNTAFSFQFFTYSGPNGSS